MEQSDISLLLEMGCGSKAEDVTQMHLKREIIIKAHMLKIIYFLTIYVQRKIYYKTVGMFVYTMITNCIYVYLEYQYI